MKFALLLALVLVVILISYSERSDLKEQFCPGPKGHVKALYVRDASHHCKLANSHKGSLYLADDGTPKHSWSWDTYECDNNIDVFIDDDAEQP